MSKKTNDPLATRRLKNRPKASKVEQAKEVKGAHEKSVERQIESNRPGIIPNKDKSVVTTSLDK